MGFPPLCPGNSALSSQTFAFFETTKSFSDARNISVHVLAPTSSEICTRQHCKKHEWLVRFSDDVKAHPRELSVVKRIIANLALKRIVRDDIDK